MAGETGKAYPPQRPLPWAVPGAGNFLVNVPAHCRLEEQTTQQSCCMSVPARLTSPGLLLAYPPTDHRQVTCVKSTNSLFSVLSFECWYIPVVTPGRK